MDQFATAILRARQQTGRISSVLGLGAVLALAGCLERTIRVTSEPPGAMVWLNDVEIGRTPAEARFKFYGVYDVRLEMQGFEPIHEGREAVAPFYEYPGPDAVATVIPARIRNVVEWHFDFAPAATIDNPAAEAAMISRAHALRDRLGPAPTPPPDPTPAPEPESAPEPPAPADIPPTP